MVQLRLLLNEAETRPGILEKFFEAAVSGEIFRFLKSDLGIKVLKEDSAQEGVDSESMSQEDDVSDEQEEEQKEEKEEKQKEEKEEEQEEEQKEEQEEEQKEEKKEEQKEEGKKDYRKYKQKLQSEKENTEESSEQDDNNYADLSWMNATDTYIGDAWL